MPLVKAKSSFTYEYQDFEPAAKKLMKCVPEGGWIKYAAFAGPPLPSSVKGNRVVLIGDAANPMSGAFGSGATFGLQDGWTFGRALTRLLDCGATDAVSKALKAFDSVRRPFYQEL
jgi:salicylate hydroxylase